MERAYLIEEWTPSSPWYKWSRNYLDRNLWRIAHVVGNDMQDALSEAALTYVETRIRYGAKINSPQHFMRLFQMALTCWVTDLANKDTHIKEGLSKVSSLEPSVVPEAELSVLLDRSSNELKEVLNIFFNAPQEVMSVLRADASSYSPKQFWGIVLRHCGIPQDKSKALINELNNLLS